MSDDTWRVRLSPQASKTLSELPDHAVQMVRDVLDLARRAPWGFPVWNPADAEGEDLRAAAVGQLTVVYWINQPTLTLGVLDIVWIG